MNWAFWRTVDSNRNAGTPVPLTGHTLAVMLTGAVLGWRRAFLAQALYLAEGAMGLPVFAIRNARAMVASGL